GQTQVVGHDHGAGVGEDALKRLDRLLLLSAVHCGLLLRFDGRTIRPPAVGVRRTKANPRAQVSVACPREAAGHAPPCCGGGVEQSSSRLPAAEEGLFPALRRLAAPGSPQFSDRIGKRPRALPYPAPRRRGAKLEAGRLHEARAGFKPGLLLPHSGRRSTNEKGGALRPRPRSFSPEAGDQPPTEPVSTLKPGPMVED